MKLVHKCRSCDSRKIKNFISLGKMPPCNSYIEKSKHKLEEIYYPLETFLCKKCFLVQTKDYIFYKNLFYDEYSYLSSYNKSLLDHSANYTDKIIKILNLNKNSKIMEIASNDGYLLQYFKKKKLNCFGVEPTKIAYRKAKQKKLDIYNIFFTHQNAKKILKDKRRCDLIIANNVLAHVPKLNDFIRGVKVLLKRDGVITFEFHYLHSIVAKKQFFTIYHEHYSYFSLISLSNILKNNKLTIFDVEELQTQGGSLRVYIQHKNSKRFETTNRLKKLFIKEKKIGYNKIKFYEGFQSKILQIKYDLLKFLIEKKKKNKNVFAYGAAAKGVTLLNYCGIKSDLIKHVIDKNPSKQNKYIPGCGIKIIGLNELKRMKPDFILILPWNLKSEIKNEISFVKKWKCKFVLAEPKLICE